MMSDIFEEIKQLENHLQRQASETGMVQHGTLTGGRYEFVEDGVVVGYFSFDTLEITVTPNDAVEQTLALDSATA